MTKQEPIQAGAVVQAHKNVYSALAAAQQDMDSLRKGSINPAFKSRYADLADVMQAVLPALNKHGLALFHSMRRIEGDNCMVTVLAHGESETMIECAVPLIVNKNDMQGMKSATTYAKRIGAESVTGIAPEDDDGNAAAAAAPKREQPRQESIADDMAAFSSLVDATVFAIGKQPTVAALKSYWQTLDFTLQADGKVIAAKDKRKTELHGLEQAAATLKAVDDEIPY